MVLLGGNPTLTGRAVIAALCLAVLVSHVAATEATITNFITAGGKRFATLDNFVPTALDSPACEQTPLTLPAGWTLADSSDGRTLYAIRSFRWGNWGVLVANGNIWRTGVNSALHDSGNYLFGSAGTGYYPSFCVLRIMITGPAEPGDVDLLESTSITNSVTFDGQEYATIDNTPWMQTTLECQTQLYALPAGWQLADLSDYTKVAIMSRPWGTQCLLTSNGAYDPRTLAYCGAQLTVLAETVSGVTYYRPTGCNTRVLIKRFSPFGLSYSSWNVRPTSWTNRVLSGGRWYFTLDDAAVDEASTCQAGAYRVPASGGTVTRAANDAGFQDVVSHYTFGTSTIHAADGSYSAGTTPPLKVLNKGEFEFNITAFGETFLSVSACPHRIMLSEPEVVAGFRVRAHALVLTPTDDQVLVPELSALYAYLRGNEIPFDVAATGAGAGLPALRDGSGDGKYAAVFLTSMLLGEYDAGSDTYIATLSESEWADLRNYMAEFHVRMVVMNGFPNQLDEFNAHTSSSSDFTLKFTYDATSAFTYPVPRKAEIAVPAGVSFITTGELKPEYAAQTHVHPFMTLGNDTSRVAAVTLTSNAGRNEMMVFFFSTSRNLVHSVLTDTAINWAFRGRFQGHRPSYLNAQIDDLFLSTETWVPYENRRGDGDKGDPAVRCNAADMNHLAAWTTYLNENIAPRGSSIKLEHAVNFLGTSERNWRANDGLLMSVVKTNIEKFNYESHTWSHLDLTCPDSNCTLYGTTTYAAADTELAQNNDAARDYAYYYAGLYGYPYAWDAPASSWSRQCMVTPRISGLFNGNALQALWDNGFRCVVGDNSIPALLPSDEYHGWYTTSGVNGFDGMFVIPRFPTNVFFDVHTIEQEATQLNYLYSSSNGTLAKIYDHVLSLPEIMDIEAFRVMPVILQHRLDAYMFHQANIHLFNLTDSPAGTAPIEGKSSLLEQWLLHVLRYYAQHSVLPIRSVKHDELYSLYLDRMARDACGMQTYLNVQGNGDVTSIDLTATASCQAVFANWNLDVADPDHLGAQVVGKDTIDTVQATSAGTISLNVGAGIKFF